MRQPTPVAKLDLSERVYCADFYQEVAVVCLADRNILVYNLMNPGQVVKTIQSPLKYQLRACAIFPDKTGFIVGSIEGRVAVQHFGDTPADIAYVPSFTVSVVVKTHALSPTHCHFVVHSKNFAFKCHRDTSSNVYPINALCFHMTEGSFATCGSDGAFHFWDKDSRSRLKQFAACPLPIVAANFNKDGTIFAYAQSYDWSRVCDTKLLALLSV